MILGKVKVSHIGNFLDRVAKASNDIHSMGRSYCGPYNSNLSLETIQIIVPMPWLAAMQQEIQELLIAHGFVGYNDLRESVLCIGGKGNSGIPFRMNNYLDIGVRVHVSLQTGGKFEGRRVIEYEKGDVILFTIEDSNQQCTHTYNERSTHLVFVFFHESQSGLSNWKAFADHRKSKE
jgi:hypothetical protein